MRASAVDAAGKQWVSTYNHCCTCSLSEVSLHLRVFWARMVRHDLCQHARLLGCCVPERQSRDWRSSRTAARLEAPVPAAVGSVCDPPGVDPGDLPARMPRRQAESHASLPPCRPARRPARLVTTPPRSCHRRRLHTHGDQRLQHRRLCCVRPGHVQEHARSLLQGGAAALSRVRCQRVRPSRRISVPLHVRHAARGRADPAACLSHARARNAGDSRAGPV